MTDHTLERVCIFAMLSMLLLTFSLGLWLGVSVEKRRHCQAVAQTSSPTQACVNTGDSRQRFLGTHSSPSPAQ